MKFPVSKRHLFTRTAAAAAVIAALASSPVFASDFTGSGVSASVPAAEEAAPDTVTITGTGSTASLYLAESGDSVKIFGNDSVSITGPRYTYAAIGSKASAKWRYGSEATESSIRAAYPASGSLDIETGEGGTIAIKGGYDRAIVWVTPDDAEGSSLALTVNGDKTASAVTVSGGIAVSGAGAEATLNILTPESSFNGEALAVNGGTLNLNLQNTVTEDSGTRQRWTTGDAIAKGEGSTLNISTHGTFDGELQAYTGGTANLTLGEGAYWVGTARASSGSKISVTLEKNASWRPEDAFTSNSPDARVSYSYDDNAAPRTDMTPDFTAVVNGDWLAHIRLDDQAIASITVNDGGTFHGKTKQYGTSKSIVTVNEGGEWNQGAVLYDESETQVTLGGYLAQAIRMSDESRASIDILSTGYWADNAAVNLSRDINPDDDRAADFTASVSGIWNGKLNASGSSRSSVTVNEGGVWTSPGDNIMIVMAVMPGAFYGWDEPVIQTAESYFSLTRAAGIMSLTGGSAVSVTDNGEWYGRASLEGGSSADITIGSTGVWSYLDPESLNQGGFADAIFLTSLSLASFGSLSDASGNLILDVSDGSAVTVENNHKMYGAAGAVGTDSSITMTVGKGAEWSYMDPLSVPDTAVTPAWSQASSKVILGAGLGATVDLTDNGTIRGIAEIFDEGTTAEIGIARDAVWTYFDPADPASRILAGNDNLGLYRVIDIRGGAKVTAETDGSLYGEVNLYQEGSSFDITLGKNAVWSWVDPADTSLSSTEWVDPIQEAFEHKEILAGAEQGSHLEFHNAGRMTGDIAALGMATSDEDGIASSVEGDISGTWDGGLLVWKSTASVTVAESGTWTRTSPYPVFSADYLPLYTNADEVTPGMLLAASSAVSAFEESDVTVENNGSMTGGAAAYGDSAVLNMTVNGTWNTGTIAGTDSPMPAYAAKNGKLNVTVGETGRMTGNVWAETGGSVTMDVAGTWTGAVKAPVIPEKWNEWLEIAKRMNSDAESAGTEAASTPAALPGTVVVTLTGSKSVWNVTESTAVNSLSIGSGTVNFPAVSDASSFTGSTLTVSGNYAGNGGTIVMNTALAGDDSATDKLVVKGDTSGETFIRVNNVGGRGEATVNGIKLIEVGGKSEGTFETAGTVRGGAYVYTLNQKGSDWYLTSLYTPPPVPRTHTVIKTDVTPEIQPDVTPEVTPAVTPAPLQAHLVRPEAASYATNLYAANTLFAMKLSDRLSGSAYADALKNPKTNSRNVWLRTEGGHTRHEMADGQTTTRGNWGLVQAGGDLASFATGGNHQFHVGLMAGFAHESAKTGSSVVNYRSKGKVSGYSAGIYGTWMNSDPTGTGPYVDTWLQYQRFKNTVDSSDYDVKETYHTKGFTASLEAGYTFGLRDWVSPNGVTNAARLRIEGQLIRMGVSGGDHFEHSTGTLVKGTGSGNVRSRFGFTLYHLFGNEATGTSVKPYLTLNWYHDTKSFGSVMDGVKDKITGSRNFGEAKFGIEGRISKAVSLWGAAGYEMGSNGLRNAEAQIGAKILF